MRTNTFFAIFGLTLVTFVISSPSNIETTYEQSDMPGYKNFLLKNDGKEIKNKFDDESQKETLNQDNAFELFANRFILKTPNYGGEKSATKKTPRTNLWFLRQG